MITFYHGPGCIIQDFLFSGGRDGYWNRAISWAFLCTWYAELMFQDAIALNRVAVVLDIQQLRFLTNKTVVTVLAFLINPFGICMAIFSDVILPCCQVYFYHLYYSFAYLHPGFNYVDSFVDLPLNTSSSVIAMICYIFIYVWVHQKHKIAKTMPKNQSFVAQKTSSREVRYAFQFACCFAFFCCSWILFRVAPAVIPLEMNYLYSLTLFTLMAHISANSFLFVAMNPTFQREFLNFWSLKMPKMSTTKIQTVGSSKVELG
uniref:7TM GPCR serpentine receptor class x (Srx) domain-containing protein n=1 Tax=Panagrolaimus sp. JU765 TaxID=591449 RepID=A0AC34RTC3_9BILA